MKAAVAMSYKLATGKWLPTGHEGPIVIAAAIVLSTPVRGRGDRLARLCTAAGSYSMGFRSGEHRRGDSIGRLASPFVLVTGCG